MVVEIGHTSKSLLGMSTCDINLPIPPERLHRTSCGASDISATVHVRVVAWPDIAFLSVPVIAGRVYHFLNNLYLNFSY